MPGTYDTNGYYEAQWGYLLDSQPCYVMCVAELFDQTGDQAWLRGQKTACERVLDYLLRRDTDGNGLVEMMTDSKRSSGAATGLMSSGRRTRTRSSMPSCITPWAWWADAEESWATLPTRRSIASVPPG